MTTTYPPSDDDDSHDNDVDFNDDDDEVAEILAKEKRRLELKRASQARYRARHPDVIAATQERWNDPRDYKKDRTSGWVISS